MQIYDKLQKLSKEVTKMQFSNAAVLIVEDSN